MHPRDKSCNELKQKNSKIDRYPNFPKYCGLVSGVVGGGAGYTVGGAFSILEKDWLTVKDFKPSKRAGLAGAFFGFTIFYAAGYVAGRVAKAAHIPHAVEKGVDLVKKL